MPDSPQESNKVGLTGDHPAKHGWWRYIVGLRTQFNGKCYMLKAKYGQDIQDLIFHLPLLWTVAFL